MLNFLVTLAGTAWPAHAGAMRAAPKVQRAVVQGSVVGVVGGARVVVVVGGDVVVVVVVGDVVVVVVVGDVVVVVVGGGVVVDPSTRIGSLRAIGTARPEPGSGLSSRSSYQPSGRSAGTRSCSWPAAAPGVGQ
jgi:hypothetical protein